MIKANFFSVNGIFTAFSIEGHAGYADEGKDIVCSAVSSAVMTVINGITECADIPAEVSVLNNRIEFNLKQRNDIAQHFLSALKLQLELICEDYEGTIKITVTEV